MQNSNYRNSFGISQSAIKDFRFKSPRKWKSIWLDRQLDLDKNEDNFIFGSLVDIMLFTPNELYGKFFIADVDKIPKGGLEKIVSNVYLTYEQNLEKFPNVVKETLIENSDVPEDEFEITYDISSLKDEILKECNNEAWQSSWKNDTRVNKIIEKGSEYFSLLHQCEGRSIITTELNFDAIAMVNILKSDKHVSKYFNQSKRYKNLYQVEIFVNYVTKTGYTIPLKCAIDIAHFDYELKLIKLIDFKTTFTAFDFIKSIKQYNYCDQLSFYKYMLESVIFTQEFQEKYELGSLVDFSFENPINIAIDREEKLPYVYEYNNFDLSQSKNGNTSFFSNYEPSKERHPFKLRKGWEDVLKEIGWHLENKSWDYPMSYYKHNKIEVNLLNS